MNSASAWRAIRRASVVLPVPGGPHRISECSCPLLERLAQRLAGSEHLVLADELIERARPHAIGERPQGIVGRRVAQQVRLRGARAAASFDWPAPA